MKESGELRTLKLVVGVHDLRAEYIGPGTVHTGMHTEVRWGSPFEEADRIAEEVRGYIEPSGTPEASRLLFPT